jgi:hypothetical protein
MRHLGAMIGAHTAQQIRQAARRWRQAQTRLPAASLRARFCVPAGFRGLDRQGLDMQRLLTLFETFFRANSIFLPDAGREDIEPRARKRR